MNSLKELIDKIYNDLQKSEWIEQYPDLAEKDIVAEVVQNITLDMMPKFVEQDKLEEFVENSEKDYKEETFKKYINNYAEFLNNVEQEFYN
jgi:hypothetical protein